MLIATKCKNKKEAIGRRELSIKACFYSGNARSISGEPYRFVLAYPFTNFHLTVVTLWRPVGYKRPTWPSGEGKNFVTDTTKASKTMKSSVAHLSVLFIVSVVVIQVRCAGDDDTVIVDAASEAYSGEDTEITKECTDTEEYSRCDANPQCQRTCDNLNKPAYICPRRSCVEGCICKNNFVRNELLGGCIPKDQCGRVKH